ncbi:DUF4190 domain-containing protein [Streptomyces sp. NPDC088725]|uniref:DUF4190 domain-containing protein n=1 Tax=Streptomyces sp. NPDC088725 TaxID=3365873 RepID=UPI003807A51B
MSEKSEQPPSGYEPHDPWAPPGRGQAQDASASQPPRPGQQPQWQAPQPYPPQAPPPPGSVHDQPTVVGIPSPDPGKGPASGAVPPPPVAPGGPAQPAPGPYGYPGAPQTAPSGVPPYPDPYAPGATYGPPPAAPGYPGTGYAGTGYPGSEYPSGGYPAYGNSGWPPAPQGQSNGLGVTAMVLGILSVVLFWFVGLGIVLGILALIFGAVGLRKARRGEASNSGVALAGVILGPIGVVASAAFLALILWTANHDDGYDSTVYDDSYETSLVVHGVSR